MDHALQMISYIADIGNIVVLMARRKPANRKSADSTDSSAAPPKKCWMICHVFSSEDVSLFCRFFCVMSTLIKIWFAVDQVKMFYCHYHRGFIKQLLRNVF